MLSNGRATEKDGAVKFTRSIWRLKMIRKAICKVWSGQTLGTALGIILLISLLAGSANAAPYAYITNLYHGDVSVIDTANDTVTATINVGAHMPFGVAVNAAGTRVYVTNIHSSGALGAGADEPMLWATLILSEYSTGGTVSVIDTTTNNVTSTVDVGMAPYGVAVNPTGSKVYVTNTGDNNVSVIDTATNEVTTTVNVGRAPYGVAVNPAGTKVYVANAGSNSISVIDAATNQVISTVNVGNKPYGVAVNPAGTRVYVTNSKSNTVSVIDATTNKVLTTVEVGWDPLGVAVNPAGTRVYVANSLGHAISVIDTASNSVITDVNVGWNPLGVAVNPAGTKVYVANSHVVGSVSVIDAATNNVTAEVSVGTNPVAFGQFIGPAIIAKTTPERNTQGTIPKSPGFEMIFAIGGMLAVAYVLRRKD